MSQFLHICLTGYFSMIATIAVTPSVSAQLFNSPIDQLPVTERVKLRKGKPLVTGEKGAYTARVLVTASSPDIAWEVLTETAAGHRFTATEHLPSSGASRLLSRLFHSLASSSLSGSCPSLRDGW